MSDEDLQKAIMFVVAQLNNKLTTPYVRAALEPHLTDLLFQQRKRAAEKEY